MSRHAISQEMKHKLLAWRHRGFSAHVGEPIPPQVPRSIEDLASYLVRSPLSLERLVYVDGQQAVIYRGLKPNPRLGANSVAMDPLERPVVAGLSLGCGDYRPAGPVVRRVWLT